jgi:hypothetical protein
MDRPNPRTSTSVRLPFKKDSSANVRCSICEKPVTLECAKADEYGRTIHEECYALKMKLKRATTPPAA